MGYFRRVSANIYKKTFSLFMIRDIKDYSSNNVVRQQLLLNLDSLLSTQKSVCHLPVAVLTFQGTQAVE
tara:strand:- start:455 stop:661 length:207 start_codon:yes stop_codon:yes gene_type:complete